MPKLVFTFLFLISETYCEAAFLFFSSCVGGLQGHQLALCHLVSPVRLNTVTPSPPLSSPHPQLWRGSTAQGGYYARGMTAARQRGDPRGKASTHLNNLLHQLTHLHIWALPSHWGTMIHFPLPDCVVTSMKQDGY